MKDDWHVTDVKDSSTMKPAQIFVQVTIKTTSFCFTRENSMQGDVNGTACEVVNQVWPWPILIQ